MTTKIVSLFVLGAALAACSGSDECTATYAGNYAGTFSVASGCGAVKSSATTPGEEVLTFDLTSKEGVTLAAQFDVGGTAMTGTLTSEEALDWQAIGTANSDCQFTAGAKATPAGNFNLVLTSVPTGDGAAHGTLHVEQYVEQPPGTDCGPVNTETVDLQF